MHKDKGLLTPKRAEFLMNLKIYIQNIESCINDILDGISESTACASHNINKSEFRRLLFKKTLGWNGPRPTEMDINYMLLSPSETIYQKLFSCSIEGIPTDTNKTVPYVMQKYLRPRERKVLQLIYWKNCKPTDVAREMNLTSDRIRRIEAKALRKLSSTQCKRIMELGLEYEKICHDTRQKIQDEKREAAKRMLKEEETKELQNIAETESIWNAPIEELGLSVRSYNGIKQHGINTVSELCGLTEQELVETRNLGAKSADEIISKLYEYGFTLKEEENKH